MKPEEGLCWALWFMPALLLLLLTKIPWQSSEYMFATVNQCGFTPLANQHHNCRAYADSKTLTEDKRESLFEAIQQDIQISFLSDALSAADISMSMLSRQVSICVPVHFICHCHNAFNFEVSSGTELV